MRCNVVGREGGNLVVNGGAGGEMTISTDVLAAVVHVVPPTEGEGDPREARIITRRSTGRWTCNLGPRATLIGPLDRSDTPGGLVLIRSSAGSRSLPTTSSGSTTAAASPRSSASCSAGARAMFEPRWG